MYKKLNIDFEKKIIILYATYLFIYDTSMMFLFILNLKKNQAKNITFIFFSIFFLLKREDTIQIAFHL